MIRTNTLAAILGSLLVGSVAVGQTDRDGPSWTVYIANDNCPDYTWGFTEERTRQAVTKEDHS